MVTNEPRMVTNEPRMVTSEPRMVTYAVDNPLYDSLPVKICDNNSAEVEEASSTVSRPPSEGTSLISPPASIISDSVAYCGRFPVQDRHNCTQCGEPLSQCQHQQTREDEVSSVSSSSVPSVTVSDQPLTFNTFHPFGSSTQDQSHTRHHSSISAALDEKPPTPTSNTTTQHVVTRLQVSNLANTGKKRLSAIELPTGETYLPIEQRELAVINPSALERDLGMVAKEYRGGGTLPRHGLQQEWLEASLNYTDSANTQQGRQSKDRSSSERGNSLPRRKSTAKDVKIASEEHTDVASK